MVAHTAPFRYIHLLTYICNTCIPPRAHTRFITCSFDLRSSIQLAQRFNHCKDPPLHFIYLNLSLSLSLSLKILFCFSIISLFVERKRWKGRGDVCCLYMISVLCNMQYIFTNLSITYKNRIYIYIWFSNFWSV
jgi:hypothetical protein